MTTHSFRLTTVLGAAAMLTAAWTAAPTIAQACGGTFCDAGPQSMPVDQTGENILFVMEEGYVEAHIQIQYTGNPEKFAWVVPVMALPEIEVGSDPLFTNLLSATVPTFTLNTQQEDNCFDSGGGGFGCAYDEAAAGVRDDFMDEEPPQGPNVVLKDTAGAFEYAVLQGGTVEGITQWLDENGYAQDEQAPQILEEYLNEGFMFVAFKLQAGAGLDEIHPVVVRYQGSEPCVPIRLTRIAAQDDMGIRAFFLGDARVVPSNYRHVRLNPLKIDWIGLGRNYRDVVTQAVDEQGADGHAFVTEYAGSSEVVPLDNIYWGGWSSGAFGEIEPANLTDELLEQQLYNCDNIECVATHPLLPGLLSTYFPAPAGVSDQDFYACTSCYAEDVDPETWDPSGFAAAFEERIAGPGENALDLLGLPYLTRLFTTMSAGEMTSDPLFHENSDLPPVSNQWTATRVIDCEGPDRLELSDGREIIFDEGDLPPTFDDMPFSARVEEIAIAGGPMAAFDNEEDIDSTLDRWNDDHRASDEGCDCRTSRQRFDGAGPLLLMLMLGLRARRRPRSARR